MADTGGASDIEGGDARGGLPPCAASPPVSTHLVVPTLPPVSRRPPLSATPPVPAPPAVSPQFAGSLASPPPILGLSRCPPPVSAGLGGGHPISFPSASTAAWIQGCYTRTKMGFLSLQTNNKMCITYIYMYIYIYTYIHIYTYICTYICIYVYTCVCIYIYIGLFAYA